MGKFERLLSGDRRDPREELAEIFDVPVPASGSVQPEAVEWARSHLDGEGMTQVEAIRILRTAEPRLGLKTATYLAAKVVAK